MADNRLETSLHPVHDLAVLPSAFAAVIRVRINERQTRNIAKAAYVVGLIGLIWYCCASDVHAEPHH